MPADVFKRSWRIRGRWRIPYNWYCLERLWTPRWLRRWYYRVSTDRWGHCSNHHWKMSCFHCRCRLRPGERCLWSGSYVTLSMREFQPLKISEMRKP